MRPRGFCFPSPLYTIRPSGAPSLRNVQHLTVLQAQGSQPEGPPSYFSQWLGSPNLKLFYYCAITLLYIELSPLKQSSPGLLTFCRDCPRLLCHRGRERQGHQETRSACHLLLCWPLKSPTALTFLNTRPDSFNWKMRNLRPKEIDLLSQVTHCVSSSITQPALKRGS